MITWLPGIEYAMNNRGDYLKCSDPHSLDKKPDMECVKKGAGSGPDNNSCYPVRKNGAKTKEMKNTT